MLCFLHFQNKWKKCKFIYQNKYLYDYEVHIESGALLVNTTITDRKVDQKINRQLFKTYFK